MKRWRPSSPITDFSITQKVRTTLIESGHPNLVVESIGESVRELEEGLAVAIKRIEMLEQINYKRITDTGVNRIIDAKLNEAAIDWGKWALKGVMTFIVGTGVLALVRAAWKGFKP